MATQEEKLSQALERIKELEAQNRTMQGVLRQINKAIDNPNGIGQNFKIWKIYKLLRSIRNLWREK